MELTLKDARKVKVLNINLEKGYVDFKWKDGVYGGVCVAPMEVGPVLSTAETAKVLAAVEIAAVKASPIKEEPVEEKPEPK